MEGVGLEGVTSLAEDSEGVDLVEVVTTKIKDSEGVDLVGVTSLVVDSEVVAMEKNRDSEVVDLGAEATRKRVVSVGEDSEMGDMDMGMAMAMEAVEVLKMVVVTVIVALVVEDSTKEALVEVGEVMDVDWIVIN